jgi:hypothetical protein
MMAIAASKANSKPEPSRAGMQAARRLFEA